MGTSVLKINEFVRNEVRVVVVRTGARSGDSCSVGDQTGDGECDLVEVPVVFESALSLYLVGLVWCVGSGVVVGEVGDRGLGFAGDCVEVYGFVCNGCGVWWYVGMTGMVVGDESRVGSCCCFGSGVLRGWTASRCVVEFLGTRAGRFGFDDAAVGSGPLPSSGWVFKRFIGFSLKYRWLELSHSSCCSIKTCPARYRNAAGFGNVPTHVGAVFDFPC
jgi:hypothetical protein